MKKKRPAAKKKKKVILNTDEEYATKRKGKRATKTVHTKNVDRKDLDKGKDDYNVDWSKVKEKEYTKGKRKGMKKTVTKEWTSRGDGSLLGAKITRKRTKKIK